MIRIKCLLASLLVVISCFIFASCGEEEQVSYKIYFVVDGRTYATIDTNGNEVISMPDNPTKEGYTFAGWYFDRYTLQNPFTSNSILDAPLSRDMSVYAKFEHVHEWENEYHIDRTYHWQTCSLCNEINSKAVHEYGEWEIIKPATENTKGLKKRVCNVCKYEDTDEIEKIHAHKWNNEYKNNSLYHWQTCSECKEINNRAEHEYGEWEIVTPATESTTGLKQKTCTVCGYVRTEQINKLQHSHNWIVEYSKDATYHWQTCSDCEEINNKAVHEYGEWEITTPATEESKGVKRRICIVCGHEETEEIERLEHTHDFVHHAKKEPTCTEIGWDEYDVCSKCGYSTYKELSKIDHSPVIDEGYPATCTSNGLTDGSHCSVCGETIVSQKTILARHNIVTEPTIEATCDNIGFTEKQYCSICGEVIKERSIIPIRQEVNDLILSRSTLYLNVGDSYTINAIPVPQNSVISVSWNSSDNNVATVNNGKIEAKNKGTVRIIASGSGFQAVCEIIVGESKTGSDTYQDYELTYSLNLDSSAYVVTGFNGNAKNIVIPDIYNALRVISIGNNAFKNNEYLETITLPNSIQGIGSNAFYGCSKLKTINIPASVKEIGVSAFENCYMLQSISIPKNVTNISESTFERCLSLKSVTIADGVKTIGNKAFERCASLTSIVLPNSIISVGNWAFNHAESLNQVTLSSSMSQIGVASFSGCYALKEIELPSNITGIGASAFSDCTNLETLRILGNISTIGNSAFYKCVYLRNVYWNSQNNSNCGDDNYIFYNCGINSGGITVTVKNNAELPTKIFEPVSGYLNLPYVIKILYENGNVYSCSDHLPYLITGIIFEDTKYAYDGNEHTLKVGNLPEIASVYYENNRRTTIGKQHVKAYISIGFAIQIFEADLAVYPSITTETILSGAGEYTKYINEPIEPGERIILTASTNNSYTWLGWYEGDTKVSVGESLLYTFTMGEENKIYIAKWSKFDLAKNIEDGGNISLLNDKYVFGQEVTVIAETNEGYTWLGWYDEEIKVSEGTSLSYTFTMGEENKIYTAKWAINKYTITIDNQAEGAIISGIISGSEYEYNSQITLIATNIVDGYFIKWARNDGIKYYGTLYTFNMPASNITITTTINAYARNNNEIYFGLYPQTKVTDTNITTALNNKAGTLPTSLNSYNWTSYGYYINNSVNNYMWYIDIEYGKEKYRGVYFTSYRPSATSRESSSDKSYQDDNGYNPNTVYWFKYKPIKWKIIYEKNGEALILADLILDSQQFGGYYRNNYANSTIRQWLNKTFYNTAFSELQKQIILTTEVKNSARSTNPDNNPLYYNNGVNEYAATDSATWQEKIFLLSIQEVTNSSYGFDTTTSSSTTRTKQGSDYAKSQGLYVYSSNSYWWLRSPCYYNAEEAHIVKSDGITGQYIDSHVSCNNSGVVPALTINLE
ncbi:MAG: leucine-rich repeat protein [Clostridia bacterium]|nr:leucine-rich repeat protein [Clostridia bacterium]